MRYALFDGDAVTLCSAEPSAPQQGETLVRVILAALTRSDVVGDVPRVPGRAVVGVDENGARVVLAPDLACATCDRCRAGLGAHCESRLTLGDPGAPGALAEALIVPKRQAVPVPDHVGDEAAVLAVAASTALQAAGRLHIRESPYATVIGAGVEAVLAASALAQSSATVRVLSSNPATLDACEKRSVRSRPTDDAGRLGDQDVVVVCPGEPGALDTALRMTAPRGRVVLTPGVTGAPDSLAVASEREIDLLGSRWAPIAEGLGAISDGRLDVSGLLTKRVKLDRAGEAIDALRAGAELAVTVDFS